MLSGGNGVLEAVQGGGGSMSGGAPEGLAPIRIPASPAGFSNTNASDATATPVDLSGIIQQGPPKDIEDTFIASADAITKNILVFQVPLNAKIYAIRIPTFLLQGTANSVMTDWQAGKYTQPEVDFLHALNLRPSMMAEIFPDPITPWQHEVAKFLKNVSVSKCFQEETLLTSRECQNARHFVNKVYEYFLLHDERIKSLYDDEDKAREALLMDYVGKVHTAATATVEASTADPTKDPELINIPSGMFDQLEQLGTFKRMEIDGKFVMPVLVVKQASGDYYFKGVTLKEENDNIKDLDLLQKFKEKVAALKVKYTSWNFII
jgi:hypothetical protein